MRTARERTMPFPGEMSVAEFEALPEPQDEVRYELVDGHLRAQDAASDTHGTIQANLARLIGNHLFKSRGPCRIVTDPGITVRVNANFNKRIPDLGVTCDPNHAGGRDMPTPKVLIEILPPSNKAQTLSNVWTFTTIPSLREIVVISSFEQSASVLARNDDGSWPVGFETVSEDEKLAIPSIGFSAPLSELYYLTYLANR